MKRSTGKGDKEIDKHQNSSCFGLFFSRPKTIPETIDNTQTTNESHCLPVDIHSCEEIHIADNMLQRSREDYVKDFIYLIACEGEDNQTKAEAMLNQYPDFANDMVSLPLVMHDTVRHFTDPMSAYGYAYWAGDTRMRAMLNKHINTQALKDAVVKQCKKIKDIGVNYEIQVDGISKTITGSTRFNYLKLKDAYRMFRGILALLIKENALDSDSGSEMITEAWNKIGQEWARAPVYILQEICSLFPFSPLDKYELDLANKNSVRLVPFYADTDIFHRGKYVNAKIVRTVRFYNEMSNQFELLVDKGVVHPGLGVTFSISKAFHGEAGLAAGSGARFWDTSSIDVHIDAIHAIYKSRKEGDVSLCASNLMPTASSELINRR